MKSFRFFESLENKARYIVLSAALLLALLIPAIASAAQLTERSIELSSSSKEATNVTYSVNFTADGAAGAFVVDFCSNSPTIGLACTAPTGFSLSGVTSSDTVSALDANTVRVTKVMTASEDITVDLNGITNPTNAGPLYARIVTYNTAANADAYVSLNADSDANVVDYGGAAISITNSIGVSAAVLETMTFCVSGSAININCTNVTAPTLALGETVGDSVALVPTAVSTGTVYTQISTNAVGGAVIRLKSSALGCGGLMRAGAPTACDITPALDDGISAGDAKFGVRTSAATDTNGANAAGILQPVTGSNYNNSTYALNYTVGDASGVTSVFGDPFLDTNNAPANNKNMALTFGASASNSTPAGLYSADISLIATGRF